MRIQTYRIRLYPISFLIFVAFLVALRSHTIEKLQIDTHKSYSCNMGNAFQDESLCVSEEIESSDINSFSFSLFSTLVNEAKESNILISPFSIASALAILLAGATVNSDCENQIMSALSVSSHSNLPALANKIFQLSSDDHLIQFTTANGIWIKDSIRDSYVVTIKEIHDAKVSVLPKTYESIDEYITQQTHGHITKMLEGDIDPLTVAIVVNAVYFKGNWSIEFDETKTSKGVFHSYGDIKRDAMFMNMERRMEVAVNVQELGGASIVRLNYGKEKPTKDGKEQSESEFCSLFFLPKTGQSMTALFSNLSTLSKSNSNISLKNIIEDQMSMKKVNLILPRFRVSYGVNSLKSQLKSLGISDAFDGRDVFSQMSDDPDVHVSDILHKAVIEVTEKGTVAAAATVGIIGLRSMPNQRPPLEMLFDRPFGMVVLHSSSCTPLFIGKINDPEFIL